MKLSFASLGCPAWSIQKIVEQASAMGYDGVELRGVAGEHISPREPDDSCRHIRDLFAKARLEVCCLMGYSHFASSDQARRRADEQSVRELVATARKVGCPVVRFFGGPLGNDSRSVGISRIVESIRAILPDAQAAGVRLALETHDDWRRAVDVLELLRRVDSPTLGVCWDIGNTHRVEPVEATAQTLGHHIIHAHYKDLAVSSDDHSPSVLPGEGSVPAARALAALRRIGYHGFVSFEWEKKWQPALPEPEVAFPAFIRHLRPLLDEAAVPARS